MIFKITPFFNMPFLNKYAAYIRMPAKIEGIFAFKAPLPRWMSIWAMQLLHHPRDGESTSTRLWHFQKASHL